MFLGEDSKIHGQNIAIASVFTSVKCVVLAQGLARNHHLSYYSEITNHPRFQVENFQQKDIVINQKKCKHWLTSESYILF